MLYNRVEWTNQVEISMSPAAITTPVIATAEKNGSMWLRRAQGGSFLGGRTTVMLLMVLVLVVTTHGGRLLGSARKADGFPVVFGEVSNQVRFTLIATSTAGMWAL